MSEKLYVLVRKDLPAQQQAVQAGHAVAEFLLRGPKSDWSNGTLVYLGVRNSEMLRRWLVKLSDLELPTAVFKEPDLNNEMTALAVSTDRHDVFRSLRLAMFA